MAYTTIAEGRGYCVLPGAPDAGIPDPGLLGMTVGVTMAKGVGSFDPLVEVWPLSELVGRGLRPLRLQATRNMQVARTVETKTTRTLFIEPIVA